MTFLLGISLIAYDINNEEISRMGKFGNLHGSDIHRTPSSILQHLILYDYLHLFDQYFVLLPSVAIIKAVRIPIHVVARETVKFHCVEDMSFVIGGPCSGFELILLVPPHRDYDGVHEYRICRAEIIIIAIAVAYIANLMRVVTRYIVGYYYGEDLMYMVHVHLEWVIFVIVVAVLLHLLENMRLKRK